MKWRSEGPRIAAVLLLGIGVSLILAEVAVRLFVSVRDVGPSFTIYDPEFGKRIKAGFSAERITPEFRMQFSTNSLGFRGPEPDRFPQQPIVFLGDSFTLGYGVSDGEEFPARIAAELRRRYGKHAPPVVNAGVGDSGNGYWVKFLRKHADAMQPRLVVMQVLDNDFADNLSEKLFALAPGGSLQELPVPPPGATRKLQAAIEAVPGLSYSYLVGLLRQVRATGNGSRAASTAGAPQTLAQAEDQLTVRIVDEAIAICKARGWKVMGLLVGLPQARAEAMGSLFARYGIPIVVIAGKRERPDLYYKIDGHWHAGGHAYAADRAFEALSGLGMLSQ